MATIDAYAIGRSAAINPPNGTAPTWTGTTGNWNGQSAAFSYSPTACFDGMIMDWSGGSNTTLLTAALMAPSTFGMTDSYASSNSNWSFGSTPATGMTFSTSAVLGLQTTTRLCGSGGTYANSSTLGMAYNYNTAGSNFARYIIDVPSTTVSMGYSFQTTVGNTATLYDTSSLTAITPGNSQVTIGITNGYIDLECSGGTTQMNNIVAFSSNTWYWITYQATTTGATGKVYAATNSGGKIVLGSLLGTTTCAAEGWTAGNQITAELGRVGGGSASADTAWYGTVKIDPAGNFPVLP
jgi:hypothetical protein